MAGAWLVPLMTLVLAVAPDAAALVARLGSGTPAERAEAARQLEAMGRGALPALEAALRLPAAEARSRIVSVWERIQKGLLVRPAMVRLEGQDRPLSEVAGSIGQQAGFSLRVSQQGPEQLINAREPRPIPFWEAVNRLGLRGGSFDITNPIGGHFPTLDFGGFGGDYPSTIAGPFRITFKGLHDHRDRLLIAGPWLRIDEMNQRIAIRRTDKEREARFYLDFGMQIEPRMWFTQEGPARAIEAVERPRPVARPARHGESRGRSFRLLQQRRSDTGSIPARPGDAGEARPIDRPVARVDSRRGPGPEARAGRGDSPVGSQ